MGCDTKIVAKVVVLPLAFNAQIAVVVALFPFGPANLDPVIQWNPM